MKRISFLLFCILMVGFGPERLQAMKKHVPLSGDPYVSEWTCASSGHYVKIYKDRETASYKALVFEEAFANAEPLASLDAVPEGGSRMILSSESGWKGSVNGTRLKLDGPGGLVLSAQRLDRVPSNLGRVAPEGAIVLFDGNSLDQWQKLEPKQWTEGSGPASESAMLLPEGALRLVPRDGKNGSIISKDVFSDFFLHLEFRVPEESQVNGGVYLLSKYEINIKDTFGQGKGASCCSLGNVSAPQLPQPAHNYALPPMVWQTLEADFKAPRFDADGKKLSNACVTVWFNGEMIYDSVEIETLKGAVARRPELSQGPVYLQEHGVSYDFRNIWVVDKAVPRPKILAVAHAAFFTSDYEQTCRLYGDFFGYEHPSTIYTQNGDVNLTIFKINDYQYVEIFKEREAGAPRMYHYAVLTDDAEGMRLYLQSKGVTVPDKTPKGRVGNYNYFIKDPNGVICEIVQYGEDGEMAANYGLHMPQTRISAHMSHVGFQCPDLDKALAFYQGILGFKEVWRGGPDPEKVKWVHLQVPEGEDTVELMLYEEEPSLAQKGSMNHICLEVDDVNQAKSVLDGRAYPSGCKSPTPPKFGFNKKAQINYYDPDQTRIEVMAKETYDGVPAPSSQGVPMKYGIPVS
ncbi:MAG: DUF1080 domain-containing protein [Bacteroidales bacterium]|nr:DUF1080 domain-containing protein [Bacteroidales bacterium]